MSTRSGRRIHLSFHENTVKSEAEIPKSERKTRSKHIKENLEESQPIPKAKKRNYVAYPGDNVTGEVDAVDGRDEGRTTRALRKNTLKERNCGSPTEVANPPSDNKLATELSRSVRSTRRTRKFLENIEDAPESVPQDEEQLSKPKKEKKKKKKAEKEEIEEDTLSNQQKVEVEVKTVPKKKSKRKGRGSGSMVVEDIVPEAGSTLNKSNMSVDSFHSAAGSPRNTDNDVDEVPKAEDMDKVIEIIKTKSSGKPDISTKHVETEKPLRRRKSSRKIPMDVSEDDGDKGEESTTRNSNSLDTLLLPNTKDEENNSTNDVEEKKNTSTRKSKRATFDKTITPRKVNTTFDKESNDENKISDVPFIADEVVEPAEDNLNTTFDKDVDIESVKGKRKSSRKIPMDVSEDDGDKGEESTTRNSNSLDTLLLPNTKDEENNSTNNVEEKKNTSTRKSKRATFDKTITPRKVNTTFDKESNDENKISNVPFIADEVVEPAEDNLNTTFDKDVDIESVKGKRKSAINALTQITNNKPTPKKSNKKKSIANYLFENNEEASVPEDKKSLLDGTYSYNSADNSSQGNMNTTVDKDLVIESVKGKRKSAINIKSQMSHNNKLTPSKSTNRKSSIDMDTSENYIEAKVPKDKKAVFDATYITAENSSPLSNKANKKSIVNTIESSSELEIDLKKNETYDLTSSPFNSACEISSPVRMDYVKRKSVINTTVEIIDSHVTQNCKSTDSKITTFEKEPIQENVDQKNKRKSSLSSLCISSKAGSNNTSTDIDQDKKLDLTFDKHSKSSIMTSDSSMITLDKSNISRISITSDESKNEENILNSTPMLIESSLDESAMNTTQTKETTPAKTDTNVSSITPLKREGTFSKGVTEVINSLNTTQTKVIMPVKNDTSISPITPLKREGTFTKDETEIISSPRPRVSRTPPKSMSVPSPGFTPFHLNKSSSKERRLMNVTRSIEKRRSSLLEPPRTTKVMFCSPVNNPAVVNQIKKKVIKSSLKGSNKSFVFDESAKLAEPSTPSKKAEAKISRTKLPNFAALHQKGFDKMESLDQCQQRKARRARQLLTPNGAVAMLDRISPKDKTTDQEKPPEKSKDASEKRKESGKSKEAAKPDTPIKSLPTFKSLNPGYTRFGFKLNLDVNPFSIPSKPATKTANTKPKENKPNGIKRQATLPSLAGATSLRREAAKQTVMREKSFTDRRNEKRTENRTVIKGVRTNRRFELQMKMRDI